MTDRRPSDARPQVSRRVAGEPRRSVYEPTSPRRGPGTGSAEPRRGGGPHIGPIAITPIRLMLLVALAGGIGFLVWSLLERDALQIPLMATGFALTGLVLLAMAILAVINIVRAGHEGRDGAAVLTAIFGGVVAMGAMLCLAAAVIFSMIWSGTTSS